MNKPRMIIFDYGHTLLYEPEFDFLRGEKEVYKHIVKNPKQLSIDAINKFGEELFKKSNICRIQGFELHEWQMLRLKYEYLGIELDISYAEAEKILWNHVSLGACMPFVEEMLDCLKENGIRSGVISNIVCREMLWQKGLIDYFPKISLNLSLLLVNTVLENQIR